MVTIAAILLFMYPTADPREDFVVQDTGTEVTIVYWNTVKLGPQPTMQQIADAGVANETAITAKVLKEVRDVQTAATYAKLVALRSMSPAEVQAWCTANITNLAQAKDAITTLAIAVSILARRL